MTQLHGDIKCSCCTGLLSYSHPIPQQNSSSSQKSSNSAPRDSPLNSSSRVSSATRTATVPPSSSSPQSDSQRVYSQNWTWWRSSTTPWRCTKTIASQFKLSIRVVNSRSDNSGKILASPFPLKPSMLGISNLPEEILLIRSEIAMFCVREAVVTNPILDFKNK